MTASARRSTKPKKAPSSERVAKPGADGRTLGQRFREAMAYKSGVMHSEYREIDLVADVNRLVGASKDSPAVSQQVINAILQNKVTRSWVTTFVATACGVNPTWLASGMGSMLNK